MLYYATCIELSLFALMSADSWIQKVDQENQQLPDNEKENDGRTYPTLSGSTK